MKVIVTGYLCVEVGLRESVLEKVDSSREMCRSIMCCYSLAVHKFHYRTVNYLSSQLLSPRHPARLLHVIHLLTNLPLQH